MSYAARENSEQSGSPVEIYDFTLGQETFRYTTGEEPVVFATNTYAPLAGLERSAISVSQEQQSDVITIRMPATNNLVRRYINVVPGQVAVLTIRRYHRTDATEQLVTIFKGRVRSVAFSLMGLQAEISVQPITSGLSRTIPRFVFSGSCNHVLYDTNCKVNSNAHRHIEEIASIAGAVYTITGLGAAYPNNWATGGFMAGPNSTDFRLIIQHTGDDVRLLLPFPPDVAAGAEVQIFAGCDHSIDTCSSKFSNVLNYGGFNWVPRENVFVSGV